MNYPFERHHGVMVRRLYFGLRDAGLRPGQVDVLCSLAKHFPLTVSPSTREYSSKLSERCNEMLWSKLAMEWYSIQEGIIILTVPSEKHG